MIMIISKPEATNEGDFDNDHNHTTYEDVIEDQHQSVQPHQPVRAEQHVQAEQPV